MKDNTHSVCITDNKEMNQKAEISKIYVPGHDSNGFFCYGFYQYQVYLKDTKKHYIFNYLDEAEGFCEECGYDYEFVYDD